MTSKLSDEDIFYLHMAFDEYMPSGIGNYQEKVIKHMSELVSSDFFGQLYTEIYGENDPYALSMIKEIYQNSVDWRNKINTNSSLIFLTGFTGHAISIIF